MNIYSLATLRVFHNKFWRGCLPAPIIAFFQSWLNPFKFIK